ncbi:HTH-type transcriptional regulator gltR [uncultured Roseburia sp.]|uniref:LysR family transcriptional regulator n=1 Tax=Brotonthovivens ammoniilytica TaxID=2981725 RepID=A0ABT2TMU9_9FIRM|nr:LysR family transcriptional regulator [Brotonthovivens ammoniilytica]MCU6762824.1 LysR family transcriptional regulator [Brotonthovivens ammoniilytica]SCI90262.1 HTH-type transcriptional regulator gltR [uncultured Roseburia sp.]
MEIRNIRTFIKVSEIGNFSRAAAALGYAQSTVTTQIQTLEQELQVELFERNGKRVCLSAAGVEFQRYAYEILKCEEMAVEHFTNDKEPRGQIRIGVMESICASRYMGIFKAFMKRFPEVCLTIVVATTLECMDMLEKGTLDVILTLDKKVVRPYWETAHVLETKISFFCSSGHPFASKKEVTIDELTKESFIQVEEGCNYRKAFQQFLSGRGIVVRNVQEVGYTQMIIDSVVDNIGISLLPEFTLEDALRKEKIALLKVKDYSLSMWIQVIYSKNKWATPALRAFLQMSKEYLV